ncbi:ribonuclease PH [bacterium]|nr:ribonuclease PH [bacterium]
MSYTRTGRAADELRPHSIIVDFAPAAEGSCLIQTGHTRVLCTATVEEKVPPWLLEQNKGWITAEYAMLPRSTTIRSKRDYQRTAGRTHEIQRLIGRSLRAVVDLQAMGQRRIIIDCDVIQADAGTRTASVTGSWLALAFACDKLVRSGKMPRWPIKDQVAGVSLGLLDDEILLDMDYPEDSAAGVDLNLVMTGSGRLIEVQGTGEETTFDRDQLSQMLDLGWKGLQPLFELQRQVLKDKGIAHS